MRSGASVAGRDEATRGDSRGGTLLRCEDGTAILEFALVLPILFALLAGAFELGRALLVRHTMIEAVRGGARALARIPDPSCAPTCSPEVVRAVALTRDEIVDVSGLPGADLDVSSRWDAETGTVAMRASLKLDADLLRFIGLGPILTLQAVHVERRIGE